MRAAFPLLVVSIALLTGCAGGDWPGQYAEDPNTYDYPIVQKRWAAASPSALGSAEDITKINASVKKAHPDVTVREIRWISATEAMACTVRGYGLAVGSDLSYGVLKKNGDSWRIIAWYDDSI